MQQLKLNYETEEPTVSARELHEGLQIKSKYADWFKNMCTYGFVEDTDYYAFSKNLENGGRRIEHQITLDMAKQICMLQRNEKGRQYRVRLIELEKAWNTPEQVMARALKMAGSTIDELKSQNLILLEDMKRLEPKASYYDLVLQSADLMSTTQIAKDYGKSAIWLNNKLQAMGVQYKQGGMWVLYQKYAGKGYTQTKTHTYADSDSRIGTRLHTYWTQKGRLFIYDNLKVQEIYPVIEIEKKAGDVKG